MSGNVAERTMETEWEFYRLHRGGCYDATGTDMTANNRHTLEYLNTATNWLGFRPCLYIDN